MTIKLFPLAGASFLAAALVAMTPAACLTSSPTTSTSEDAASADATSEPSPSETGDSGSERDAASPGTNPGAAGCPSTKPIDWSAYPYSPGTKSPGACTAEEVKALGAYIKKFGSGDDLDAWKKTVSSTCAACAFSDLNDATWGPLLTKNGKYFDLNSGGCFEIVSKKPNCGKAVFLFNNCRTIGCGGCKDQTSFDACFESVEIVALTCKSAFSAVDQYCGSELGNYEKACAAPPGEPFPFMTHVTVQCVSP